jgi:hypothetical protein
MVVAKVTIVETGTDTEPAIEGGARGRDHPPVAAEQAALNARLEALTAERDALRVRITEAEQELARLPGLLAARAELETLRTSRSWRMTAPLRRATNSARVELIPTARLAVKRALLRLASRVRA